ncbi:TolC family protein [Myxococcus sp. K15C18031901]|uniref:TolC family protein n=1 Tax=Myxococcus dinghuensis TaxID=2906761 RepID=UPI0020A70FBA|nr:TolC family protein [Myxococcus dinghuensis]MCP3097856.1 TolC family protein [Myxococcus dinghuensis]
MRGSGGGASQHWHIAAFGAVLALLAPARGLPEPSDEPLRLSFPEAMRRAFTRNPDALIASEEIARARAIVEQVRAGSLPTATATTAYTQLNTARLTTSAPPSVILPRIGFNASGTLALPLDPRRWVQWSQARENVKVARLSARDVRRQLAVTVGQVYLSVAVQRKLVQADENAVQNAAAHVEYTRTRLDAGNGTLVDFQRASALYYSDRADLERTRFLLVRLQEQLGVLLGESAPVDAVMEVELPGVPGDMKTALEDADRLRSDLRLARERLSVAEKVYRESWADFMPSASASFELIYQTPPTQSLPTESWQLMLNVGFPVYDGGLRFGLVRERRALEGEAGIQLDATLRQVRSEVRTALAELERARAAVGLAREAARLSSEVLHLTTVSYRSGLSNDIQVIDAQLASRNAEISAALAENDARQAQLDLLIATGHFPPAELAP